MVFPKFEYPKAENQRIVRISITLIIQYFLVVIRKYPKVRCHLDKMIKQVNVFCQANPYLLYT